MEDIKNLIHKIKELNLSERGEQLPFSISQLMYDRISTRELLHSEIIATLLDPNGEPNLGTLPLEQFLTILGVTNTDDFGVNLSATKVVREKVVKVETEDGNEEMRNRFIDILLTNGSNAIIIENKLNDAVDQPNQLSDYYNSMKNLGYTGLTVVYLPLYESKSAKEKIEGVEVINIYPQNLIGWLEKCEDPICTSYAELLKYMNQKNQDYMDAKKLQNSNNLNETELTKLIEIASIINSPEWNKNLLKTIEDIVNSKLQSIDIELIECKECIKLQVENCKSIFWVELCINPLEFQLYIGTDTELEKATNIFKKIAGFNFEHTETNPDGEHTFVDKKNQYYKYPSVSDFERLITNICDLLRVSYQK